MYHTLLFKISVNYHINRSLKCNQYQIMKEKKHDQVLAVDFEKIFKRYFGQ